MNACFLLPFCVLLSTPVHAQDSLTGTAPGLTQVRDIRQQQDVLAELQDVVFERLDQGKRSQTRMVGVPLEFREEVIASKEDVEALLPRLYAYYGFTRTETLRFERAGRVFGPMRYTFRQYVDGIPTTQVLEIYVSSTSQRIERFQGALVIDTGLARAPFFSARNAIERTLECIEEMDQWGLSPDAYAVDGNHQIALYYSPGGVDGALTPWWSIGIQRTDVSSGPFQHEPFWVAHHGGVIPQAISSHHTWEWCKRYEL